jgi:uncharacterized protein DUF4235
MFTRERIWNVESTVASVVGSVIAQKLVRAAYAAIRKRNPRSVFDPDSAQFSWSTFVLWSVAGGIGLGIAKLVSNRVATVGWKIATGSHPPTVGAAQIPT